MPTLQMYEYMAFVVGGQLAKDAFDEILRQQAAAKQSMIGDSVDLDIYEEGTMYEGDDRMAKCKTCMKKVVCCGRNRKMASEETTRKKQGAARNTLSMKLDDFVNILTFNAKHKKVVAPIDGDTKSKHLSPEELQRLIQVYVQNFDPAKEKEDLKKKQKMSRLIQSRKTNAVSLLCVHIPTFTHLSMHTHI